LTGTLLLGVPDAVTGRIAGDQPRPPTTLIRVLGARLLIQGLVECIWPRRSVVRAGAAVDTAHTASMIAAAALLPAYRRTAIASAAEATASAVLTATLARRLS
jgi:hypothetical protein